MARLVVCGSLCSVCSQRNHLGAGIGPFPSQETNLALKHRNACKKGIQIVLTTENPSYRPDSRRSGPSVKELERTPLGWGFICSCISVSCHLCFVTLGTNSFGWVWGGFHSYSLLWLMHEIPSEDGAEALREKCLSPLCLLGAPVCVLSTTDADTQKYFIIKMANFLKPFPSSDLNKQTCFLRSRGKAFVTIAGHFWTCLKPGH